MRTVRLSGTADPALVAAAAARGLRFVASDAEATPDAELLGEDARPPVRPSAAPRLWIVTSGDAAIVRALDAGADDAVDAAAPPALIAARLAALVRRGADTIRFGELSIDRVERRVARCGRPIALLPREYDLLLHFVRHADRLVARAALHATLCGLPFDPGTNVIEVHVSRLRAKLDRGFAWPMLRTERGRGYRLVATPDAAIA